MLGPPTSEWGEAPGFAPPLAGPWQAAGAVDHVFTHFRLTLSVHLAEPEAVGRDWIWTDETQALAVLPTVFRKALERGLGAAG